MTFVLYAGGESGHAGRSFRLGIWQKNILGRDFKSKEQNEKWLTDVTEFKYGTGGKVYLCAILDLYGRNIAGFSLGQKNNISLVFEAFDQAFQRYPDACPMVHSDRGRSIY